MRTRFPAAYKLFGLQRRHRTSKMTEFREWVTVNIPEISHDEAPVVIRTGRDENLEEIRWADGSFWERKQDIHAEDLERLNTCREENEVHRDTSFLVSSRNLEAILEEGEFAYDPDTFKTDDTRPRDTEIERIVELASNCVLMDGGLWRKTKSPALHYRNQRFDRTLNAYHHAREEIEGKVENLPDWSFRPKTDLYFHVNTPLDEIEEVIRSFGWRDEITHPDFDVLTPDVFTHDVEAYMLNNGGEGLIQSIWEAHLKAPMSSGAPMFRGSGFDAVDPVVIREISYIMEILRSDDEFEGRTGELEAQLTQFLEQTENWGERSLSQHSEQIQELKYLLEWWRNTDLKIDTTFSM